MDNSRIYNIIVAGGSGSRFGADVPKQYCRLKGCPVLMHTIDNIRKALPGAHTLLVISENHCELWEGLCEEFGFVSPPMIIGGTTRWQSVKNAIDTIDPSDADIITVHDGARPIVDTILVNNVISGIGNASGAIPVVAVTDSLRQIGSNGSSIPVDRSQFCAVQTPQAFSADKLIKAYSLPYDNTFTDDASVMMAAGYSDINLVDGDTCNIKITMPCDIDIASIYLSQK